MVTYYSPISEGLIDHPNPNVAIGSLLVGCVWYLPHFVKQQPGPGELQFFSEQNAKLHTFY